MNRMAIRDEMFLALVVAAIVFPLISIRAYHYEEGLTAALARDALSGSPWYVPDLFGARWIERPVMQSWLAAAISWPFGGVSQIKRQAADRCGAVWRCAADMGAGQAARVARRLTDCRTLLPVQPRGAAKGGHRGS